MTKKPSVFLCEFSADLSTWAMDSGNWNSCGIYDPKFSSVGSVANGNYPDVGLQEGHVPHLIYGEYLPPEMAAKLKNPVIVVGTQGGKSKKIPEDIGKISDGKTIGQAMVSDRLKDVIERLEPGVHQFFPLSFVNVDGEPVWQNRQWYYLNIRTWIEPDRFFAWENMPGMKEGPLGQCSDSPHRQLFFPHDYSKYKDFRVRADALEKELSGKHIWIISFYYKQNLDLVHCDSWTFCSAEFRKACKSQKLLRGHFAPLVVM